MKFPVIFSMMLVAACNLMAQPGPSGSQGFNLNQIIEQEKKAVIEKIATLNADQKEVMDFIYVDYAEAFGKIRTEAAGDFQVMRTRMTEIRDEKDKAMKEVLTAEQYKQYAELMEELRQNRRRGN